MPTSFIPSVTGKDGFDLVAWCEDAPGTGVQGLAAGLDDQRYETNGDDIRVKPEAQFLNGLWYAAESTPDNARLVQSSRLQDLQFTLACDLNDADFKSGFTNYMRAPMRLRGGEMVTGQSENATDEDTLVGALLGSGAIKRWASPTHIIKGEDDKTLTACTWGMLPSITWDQDLPEGYYYILGLKVGGYIASGFMQGFARLVLDKVPWRPGVALIQSEADKTSVMSSLGEAPYHHWGKHSDLFFSAKTMPRVEVISPAALTDFVIELTVQAVDIPGDVGNFEGAPQA